MDLNETPCMNESPPQGWGFKGIKGAKFTNIYPSSCLSFPNVPSVPKARDRNISHSTRFQATCLWKSCHLQDSAPTPYYLNSGESNFTVFDAQYI